jgi:hypothetical protein
VKTGLFFCLGLLYQSFSFLENNLDFEASSEIYRIGNTPPVQRRDSGGHSAGCADHKGNTPLEGELVNAALSNELPPLF